MKDKVVPIISYSLTIIITIIVGLFLIKAVVVETKKCSENYLFLCTTQELCEINNLKWWNNSCHISQEPEPIPSEYPDYSYFINLKNKKNNGEENTNYLSIANNFTSWVDKTGIVTDDKKISQRFIRRSGELLNAYLYIKTAVNGDAALTSFDSIYVSLQRLINNYGYQPVLDGHLMRNKSLPTPPSNNTELLYNLKQISLTDLPYSSDNKYRAVDWLNLINNNSKFEIKSFLSTYSKDGVIKEIGIAYECAEETPNCKLEMATE